MTVNVGETCKSKAEDWKDVVKYALETSSTYIFNDCLVKRFVYRVERYLKINK